MPIVLATAEGQPRSGYVYDDRTGVSYEYPDVYQRLVSEGEPFLYHMPRRGYTGSGVVGRITPSRRAAHHVCEILDYSKFEESVPLMSPNGHYFEADPQRGKYKIYWSQGVRPISVAAFGEVVAIADAQPEDEDKSGFSGYASSDAGREVERFAVRVVLGRLAAEYPGVQIAEMARNHPGFDIRVGPADDPIAFVEVKGTQSAEPVFWMTEGERQFSIREAQRYLLMVVSGIDLTGLGGHELHVRAGGVVGDGVAMEPSQWRGRLATER